MDIRKKLNEIQNVLSNDQEEERNIVNDLMPLNVWKGFRRTS